MIMIQNSTMVIDFAEALRNFIWVSGIISLIMLWNGFLDGKAHILEKYPKFTVSLAIYLLVCLFFALSARLMNG